MSVKFKEELNQTIIVEDVMSDEEDDQNFGETFNNEMFDLVKDEPIQNEIIRPRVQHRPLPPYAKQGQPPFQQQQQQQQIRQQLPARHPPRNQISYDDILKTMNMRVNDGKLEMIKPVPQEANYAAQVPYQEQNSYIYNKYFKDQLKQNQQQQMPSRPLTPQERRAMMIKRYIEIENQRRRISQIKSKKLNFSTSNINISNGRQPHDLNRLFRFVGK
jgi:hypothetical protein